MKLLQKIWKTTTSVIVCVAVLLAIALVGVKLFGVQVYTVLSGSMEPHFMTGSIIYVVKADPAELKERDVITFYLGGGDTIATHRIIEVIGEGDQVRFRTKGDNNDVDDANPVSADRIIGKAVFTIPYLGYFITYVQQPPWRYIAIAVGAALLLLMVLPELLFDEKKAKEGKQDEEDK